MKRAALILLSACSVLIISCQKEAGFAADVNNGNGSGGGGSTGDLLVRSESNSGQDSTKSFYTYDNNKRIINYKVTGTSQGQNVGNEFRYYRNSTGIVTKYTQVSALLVQAGLDSVTTKLLYNTSTSRYTAAVSETSFFGFTFTDSTVFVYDAAGKIIGKDVYQGSPSLNFPMELLSKEKVFYTSNGNVSKVESYEYDASSNTSNLLISYDYTYDTKVNAFPYTTICTSLNEAIALDIADFAAKNNIIKTIIDDVNNPAGAITLTLEYTYNNANRPITGKFTQLPDNIIYNAKLFYQ
jgi:hypothetical protein